MDFGRSSSFVETIRDEMVERLARILLRAMRLTGLVEVEFKRDTGTGICYLLDVNARVWGWHTIAARYGLDFPYLLWKLILEDSAPRVSAPPGIRWLRMSTDLVTVGRELARGRMGLLPYLRTLRPPHEPAVFAADDPLPGLLDTPLLLYLAARRTPTLLRP
jgi:D-aspartate ligase